MSADAPILVLGASGSLGRAVVARLAAEGRAVRGASRDPDRVPAGAKAVRADLLDPASLRAACEGVDAVVVAAGAPVSLRIVWRHPGFAAVDHRGTVNVVAAARASGARKVVYVSVASIPELDALPYVAAHRLAADAVRASGLSHTIVRPTGFFSAFDALLPFARIGVMPQIGDGHALSNPIHEDDLAEVVVGALDGQESEITVGGPEALSRRAIAEAAFEAVGRRPRVARVPDAVLGFNRSLIRPIDRRLAELLEFLDAVSRVDLLAPARGTRRLAPYLAAQAARGRRSGRAGTSSQTIPT
jgi:uncharacterized protein YbjT (DUF2867 family)